MSRIRGIESREKGANLKPRRPSATYMPVARPSRRPDRVARALVRQLRPKQWIKNLTCFAGLIFSGLLFNTVAQFEAALAFCAFCMASSCVYIVNDFLDRENDRRNPRTARRPLATGELPLWVAGVAFGVMLATAFGVAAYLGVACVGVLAIYVAQGIWYSVSLKRVVIVDVMCIAIGFVLRVMFGVYAVGVLPTPWIILCMFFLALFLGFAKRQAELNAMGEGPTARAVLSKYNGEYLHTLIVISATTAVLTYALFTVTSHRNATLVVTVVPVIYCVCRYLLQVMVAGKGESPDETLLDPRMLVGIVLWVGLFVAISYGDIHLFAEPR